MTWNVSGRCRLRVKIKIVSIAGKLPNWVAEGVSDYERRLPREIRLEWHTLPLAVRRKDRSAAQLNEIEGEGLLKHIKPDDYVIALDVKGRRETTEAWVQHWQTWLSLRQDILFLIGGPDGLDTRCLARANLRLSLSDLTLPHALVRVVLIEQLYRAWSIGIGHPYHRA